MRTRGRSTLVCRPPAGLLLGALLAFALPLDAGEAAPTWSAEHAETVQRLRTIGAALYTWHLDNVEEEPAGEELSEFPMAAVPVIDAEALEALLVPLYLTELTKTDGWGNALEFRLDQEGETAPLMAVRSAGANGKFDEESYEPRPFGPEDELDDLVWVDGYFVRWPRPPED